jgi:hypothetical protein
MNPLRWCGGVGIVAGRATGMSIALGGVHAWVTP